MPKCFLATQGKRYFHFTKGTFQAFAKQKPGLLSFDFVKT
jgi:hypothetical protein